MDTPQSKVSSSSIPGPVRVSEELSAPHLTSVLACPKCQSPCPLGFGPVTRCVECGTAVPVSEQLQARTARQRKQEAARRAKDPLWQLALAGRRRFFRSPFFLTVLAYVAPILAAIPGYFFGYRQNLYGRAGLIWLCGIGAIHFVSATLFGQRRPEHLRELLAARAPELGAISATASLQPNQPPRCRVCAAPLSVPPPPEKDCSCDHCGADNILYVEPKLAPRPDLYGVDAAYEEVYGSPEARRVTRLYPLVLMLGFFALGVLSYFAIRAPIQKNPFE